MDTSQQPLLYVLALASFFIGIGTWSMAAAWGLMIQALADRRAHRDADILGVAESVGVLHEHTTSTHQQADEIAAQRARHHRAGAR